MTPPTPFHKGPRSIRLHRPSPASKLPDSRIGTIVTRVVGFLRARLYYDLMIPDITAQTATQVIQYFNCVARVYSTYPDLPAKSQERFQYVKIFCHLYLEHIYQWLELTFERYLNDIEVHLRFRLCYTRYPWDAHQIL